MPATFCVANATVLDVELKTVGQYERTIGKILIQFKIKDDGAFNVLTCKAWQHWARECERNKGKVVTVHGSIECNKGTGQYEDRWFTDHVIMGVIPALVQPKPEPPPPSVPLVPPMDEDDYLPF